MLQLTDYQAGIVYHNLVQNISRLRFEAWSSNNEIAKREANARICELEMICSDILHQVPDAQE